MIKKVKANVSQCSNCGTTFYIVDQVMFCSSFCEKQHDLFRKEFLNLRKIKKRQAHQRPAKIDKNTLIIT